MFGKNKDEMPQPMIRPPAATARPKPMSQAAAEVADYYCEMEATITQQRRVIEELRASNEGRGQRIMVLELEVAKQARELEEYRTKYVAIKTRLHDSANIILAALEAGESGPAFVIPPHAIRPEDLLAAEGAGSAPEAETRPHSFPIKSRSEQRMQREAEGLAKPSQEPER